MRQSCRETRTRRKAHAKYCTDGMRRQKCAARLLRAETRSKRLFALLMEAKSARRAIDIILRDLQDRVKQLSGNKRAKTNEGAQSSTQSVLDFHSWQIVRHRGKENLWSKWPSRPGCDLTRSTT